MVLYHNKNFSVKDTKHVSNWNFLVLDNKSQCQKTKNIMPIGNHKTKTNLSSLGKNFQTLEVIIRKTFLFFPLNLLLKVRG